MTVAVNMPQMAANGLSENWLFKFCGDLLWERLCRSLGTSSSALCTDSGERLYSSFVAISARYSAPLSTVKENDQLEESLGLARYGTSFFHGAARLVNDSIDLRLEMLTAFVSRSAPHGRPWKTPTCSTIRRWTAAASASTSAPARAFKTSIIWWRW